MNIKPFINKFNSPVERINRNIDLVTILETNFERSFLNHTHSQEPRKHIYDEERCNTS